ncbi:ChlI component of cobalt chelatase [Cutibacterium acnes JCM 18920]|nr:ChlI component of cobalt chelatase [Cutibacterium acnes JCM 18920]
MIGSMDLEAALASGRRRDHVGSSPMPKVCAPTMLTSLMTP